MHVILQKAKKYNKRKNRYVRYKREKGSFNWQKEKT